MIEKPIINKNIIEYGIYDIEDKGLYVNRTWPTEKEARMARYDLIRYCFEEWDKRLIIKEHYQIKVKFRAYDAPRIKTNKDISNEI